MGALRDPELRSGMFVSCKLDLRGQTATLLTQPTLNGEPMYAELRSLACGPSGQLYGLVNPSGSGVNAVFAIDISTGAMIHIRDFDVDRMIFVR